VERIPGVSEAQWDALPAAVKAYIAFLEDRVAKLEARVAKVAQLEARVAELEARLAKNSGNSHKPPSSDGPAKPSPRPQSERTSSGKKPGGQPGHSGSTLRKALRPDVRVRHLVKTCSRCQRNLSSRAPDSIEERQVFDLPPMKIVSTAHETEVKHCPGCGERNQAPWPELLAAEPGAAIYGPGIRALSVYLTQGQMLPYARTSELLEDLLGHRISAGTLANWTQKASEGLTVTDQEVARGLTISTGTVHFDETGMRHEGKNGWLHSASNSRLTHFSFHPKRGTEAIEAIGILPGFRGTAVHDRWEPYFGYEECRHGLCGAHLLRDLRFVWEQEGERWAKNLRRVLLKMNGAVRKAKARGARRFNAPTIEYWEGRYRRILHTGFRLHEERDRREGRLAQPGKRGRKKQRPGKNLLDALDEHQDSVLLFLNDFTVPFTNNQGEQDIRMTKVKLKVSGCFRSADGARHFCRIRGYLSTARKQGQNLLDAMKAVFVGAPFQPILASTG
jgi:transposase